MARPITRVAAALAVTLSVASRAVADTTPAGPVTFSLELSSVGCSTTDAQLAAAILLRVPAAERVEAGAEVAFHAEISDTGASSLTVTLAQGSSRRELQGTSCDEAAALIAFISSLVLDARPEERLKATELAAPAAAASSSGRHEATALPPKPSVAPPPSSTADSSTADGSTPDSSTPDGGSTARRGTEAHVAVSAALAFETAVANKPPPGGLFGAAVRWPRASIFAPELRAELLVTSTTKQEAPAGKVSLGLTAGRLSACPVRLPALNGELRLGLCATFDAGSLHARGSSDIQGRSQTMLWLGGGLSLLAEVPLSRAFELQLLAGAKALVSHDTFILEADPAGSGPPLRAYDVPAISGTLALGLGFQP